MTIDILTVEEFKDLVDYQHEHSLSIYMPTHRGGQDIQQDPIRFKNLLEESEDRLLEHGMSRPEVQEYLKPLRDLLDRTEFWRNQSDGLAVLYSPEGLNLYRLPFDFEELVMINDQFYISPLIPVLVDNQRYYTLALSREKVRLFAGNHLNINELDLGDTPTSLEESLRMDDPEQRLQQHTSVPSPRGDGAEMFHAHDPDNQEMENLKRFLSKIENAVTDRIGDDNAPLILMGMEKIVSSYQDKDAYEYTLDEVLHLNPDQLSAAEILEKSWDLVQPMVEARHQQALDRYHSLADGEKVSEELDEVVPAALHARIDTLFIPLGKQVWGKFDPDQQAVIKMDEEDPESRDLLDFAALHTLRNGGRVYALEPDKMPVDGQQMAAVLRF
jgi:hypothetical protein